MEYKNGGLSLRVVSKERMYTKNGPTWASGVYLDAVYKHFRFCVVALLPECENQASYPHRERQGRHQHRKRQVNTEVAGAELIEDQQPQRSCYLGPYQHGQTEIGKAGCQKPTKIEKCAG